jgi:hypothetical protein
MASLAGAALLRADPAVSLIDDPRFQRGLKVWLPTAGVHTLAGVIKPQGAAGEPAWGAAQWFSRFNLASAPRQLLASGSSRFFDGVKAVTFGAPASPEADVIFAVNGHTEYGEHAPDNGDGWVHLVMEQDLIHHPLMPALHAVPFRIEYRLLKSQAFHVAGWDDQRHTAQFQLYITVRNGNHESKGYGDFLWFGVPMYDARTDIPKRYAATDFSTAKKQGTGKFIYIPAGEQYATQPAKDGEWITIDRDLLPLMRDAMEAAWTAGFLKDSRRPDDYQLDGMNVGWEVTGPIDAAMQIRNLNLAAVNEDVPQVAALW